MDLGIKGRTALVTAASRGIGRACAFAFAREGANVVMCARGKADLEGAAAALRTETGANVLASTADVTSPQDIERILSLAKREFSGIDILVAVGGSPPRGTFPEVTEKQFLEAFEMTVLAFARLVSAVLPDMRTRKWGRIVSIQSRSVREPIADLVLSNATRPGAAGLAKFLSNDAAADGVLINTVLPGRVVTDRLRGAAERSGQSVEAFLKSQAVDVPAGRLAEAEEIADVVAFLASERASYVTGTALAVDGGLVRSI